MKKFVFLILLGLFFAQGAFAQKGLHIGGRFSPAVAYTLNGEDFDDPNLNPLPRFRMAGGIHLGYHFNDFVGLGIEVLVAGNGTRYVDQNPIPGMTYFFDLNFTYVKLPFMLKFNTKSDSRVMFQGFVGPQFSFLTGANMRSYYDDGTTKEDVRIKEIEYEELGVPIPSTIGSDIFYQTHYLDYVDPDDNTTTNKEPFRKLYSPFTIDAVLGLGMKIKVIDNLFIDAIFRFDFAMTNAQNNKAYKMGEVKKANGELVKEIYAWDLEQYRTFLPSTTMLTDRTTMFNLTGGLQVGVTYCIDFAK